ncbi:MAG: TSUP family transporter [Candidatus Puniceispirillales bacterium]
MILSLSIIFFISGLIKGIIGMGLPTISLLLLTLFLDLSTAITLIIIPSLITNLWQGIFGKFLKELISEFWLYLIISGTFVFLGTIFFETSEQKITTFLLSIIITFYSFLVLKGSVFKIEKLNLNLTKFIVFLSNGFLTGATGSLLFPGVFFFQSLQFEKSKLIQALGIHFTILTFFLGISKLYFISYLTLELSYFSIISCIAAFFGMFVGTIISSKIEERLFKRIFLYSLIIIGFLISIKIIVI